MKASQLVIPGSLVKYKIKFIPNNKEINLKTLNKLVQGTNVSIKESKNSNNNFNRSIEKTSLFITLVGLITLLISGVGISNGVRGYLIKKVKNGRNVSYIINSSICWKNSAEQKIKFSKFHEQPVYLDLEVNEKPYKTKIEKGVK